MCKTKSILQNFIKHWLRGNLIQKLHSPNVTLFAVVGYLPSSGTPSGLISFAVVGSFLTPHFLIIGYSYFSMRHFTSCYPYRRNVDPPLCNIRSSPKTKIIREGYKLD